MKRRSFITTTATAVAGVVTRAKPRKINRKIFMSALDYHSGKWITYEFHRTPSGETGWIRC